MIPQQVENLLVCGRAIDADNFAYATIRNMGCCIVTGEGAGTAAAIAIKNNTVSQVDIQTVQERLQQNGVKVFNRNKVMRENPVLCRAYTDHFMMIVLVVGIGVMGWPASVCLLISAAFSRIIAMAVEIYPDEIRFIIDKISAVMAPVLIVIFVGFMVATWSVHCRCWFITVCYWLRPHGFMP